MISSLFTHISDPHQKDLVTFVSLDLKQLICAPQ